MRILFFILLGLTANAQTNFIRFNVDKPPARSPYLTTIHALPNRAKQGSVLTISATYEAGSLTYQWYQDGSSIGGATNASYTVVSGDVGHGVYCVVTSTSGGVTTKTQSSTVLIGADYYISASGSGSGSSSGDPMSWTSFAALTLKNNTNVYLNRGDAFYVSNYNWSTSYDSIRPYGSGAIPIIYGSGSISGLTWTNDGTGKYSATPPSMPKWILKDGIAEPLAQYTWMNITATPSGSVIQGNKTTLNTLSSLVGANIIYYDNQWELDYVHTITAYDNATGNMTLDSAWAGNPNGKVFMLYNQKQFIDVNHEWYWDGSSIWYKAAANPNTFNIEAIYEDIAFTLSSDHTFIQNIEFKNYRKYGVFSRYSTPASNVTIDNCSFHDIKEYGALILGGFNGVTITNSTFNRMGITGIELYQGLNITIQNNTVSNIGEDSNFPLPTKIKMTSSLKPNEKNPAGIRVVTTDVITKTPFIVKGNTVSNTAYASIHFRMPGGEISYNEMSGFMQRFDDGGGLYGVGTRRTAVAGGPNNYEVVINNNYIHDDNSGTTITDSGLTRTAGTMGIYSDNESIKHTMSNNIISNITTWGMYINTGNYKHSITNNTIFNAAQQITFHQIFDITSSTFEFNTDAMTFTGNVMLSKSNTQYNVIAWKSENSTGYNPFSNSGSTNNNYYLQPFITNIAQYQQNNGGTANSYTLSGWQTLMGGDGSSTARTNYLTYVDAPTADTQCKIYVNWTAAPVIVNLTGYKDKTGASLGSSVSVGAYSSIVYTL